MTLLLLSDEDDTTTTTTTISNSNDHDDGCNVYDDGDIDGHRSMVGKRFFTTILAYFQKMMDGQTDRHMTLLQKHAKQK